MNETLKQTLAELPLAEKNEVFEFLVPFVAPEQDPMSTPELRSLLNDRLRNHRKAPEGAISLKEFKARGFRNQSPSNG